jgi:hypothetical protein
MVYGFPLEKAPLLPDSITPITSLEFPEESVVLSDEAYITLHSRTSMSDRNRFMDLFAGLVRQKGILGIYVTQLSRKLDIGIVSAAQVLLVKKPSLLQWKLDRSELRGILGDARAAFKRLGNTDSRQCTYVLADEFEGMVRGSNQPPSFWCEALSRPYAGVPLASGPEQWPGFGGVLCCLPGCGEPAVMICSCHQNSYCAAHSVEHVSG